MKMNYLKGEVLTDQGFKKGYVFKENNKYSLNLTHVEKAEKSTNLVIPSFVNTHTHIGDTFIREEKIPLPRDIKKLVSSPSGLKHKLLNTTDSRRVQDGINNGLKELQGEGISTFFDFRENGLMGINLLKKMLVNFPVKGIILGRPTRKQLSKREINTILANADGIGLSTIQDYRYKDVQFIVKKTKEKNKFFSIHVSERKREEIEPVLDLNPDFIVHMNQASKTDLKLVKEQNVPIVVCPRSNQFFGLKSNLKEMKEIGNTIFLGSDNFMFHSPSIIEEIRFIQKKFTGLFSLEELLLMNTYFVRNNSAFIDVLSDSLIPGPWLVLDSKSLRIKKIIDISKKEF